MRFLHSGENGAVGGQAAFDFAGDLHARQITGACDTKGFDLDHSSGNTPGPDANLPVQCLASHVAFSIGHGASGVHTSNAKSFAEEVPLTGVPLVSMRAVNGTSTVAACATQTFGTSSHEGRTGFFAGHTGERCEWPGVARTIHRRGGASPGN